MDFQVGLSDRDFHVFKGEQGVVYAYMMPLEGKMEMRHIEGIDARDLQAAYELWQRNDLHAFEQLINVLVFVYSRGAVQKWLE